MRKATSKSVNCRKVRFEVLKHPSRGIVRIPGGADSPDFRSKEAGRFLMDVAVKFGAITKEDRLRIVAEINQCAALQEEADGMERVSFRITSPMIPV